MPISPAVFLPSHGYDIKGKLNVSLLRNLKNFAITEKKKEREKKERKFFNRNFNISLLGNNKFYCNSLKKERPYKTIQTIHYIDIHYKLNLYLLPKLNLNTEQIKFEQTFYNKRAISVVSYLVMQTQDTL